MIVNVNISSIVIINHTIIYNNVLSCSLQQGHHMEPDRSAGGDVPSRSGATGHVGKGHIDMQDASRPRDLRVHARG